MSPRWTPALLVVLTALLTGCSGTDAVDGVQARSPQLKQVPPGPSGLFPAGDRQPAPALAGVTLDGGRLDVAALRGQVVVVNFWASWCAPCRAESANLGAVYAARKGAGVAFVGVNVKDDRGAAQRFEQTHAVAYPSLYDQPGVLLTRFRALAPQTPPTTLLLDRRGRVAGRFIGGVTRGELDGPVQQLAQEPA